MNKMALKTANNIIKQKIVNKVERLMVFSRHPSHNVLRGKLKVPVSTSIRFGSTTISNKGKNYVIELNVPQAVRTSSDKLLMKMAFRKNEVKTAKWIPTCFGWKPIVLEKDKVGIQIGENDTKTILRFPIVTKHRFGSRGTGNKLHETINSFETWYKTKSEEDLMDYIVEEYMNYNKEYRLHVTQDGCFYTCRKALKSDIAEDKKWFRNDSNSVWFMEDNEEMFDKPSNWSEIVQESVKALVATGLDVGAVDLRVQNSLNKKGEVRENPDFFVVEINSAPSFGEVAAQKYLEELPKLINRKLVVN